MTHLPRATKPGKNPVKEWLLLLLSLSLLGSYIVFSLKSEHDAIETRERARLATQAQVVHDNVGRQMDSINRALASVRDELPAWRARRDGMALAGRWLKAFTEAMPGVRTMTILDRSGRIASASRPELIGTDFADRAYFQAVRNAPDPDALYVSPPFVTSPGVWAMNVARMAPGPDGRFDGIVSATLDPEEFRILLNSVRYAPDVWTALAHGDGLQLQMVPDPGGQAGKNLAQPGSFFSRHMASGLDANVLSGTVHATGENRLMALRSIRPPGLKMDRPLVVAVTRELDALYAAWTRTAIMHLGLFALLTLVVVAGMYLLQLRERHAARAALASEQSLRESRERLAVATDAAGIGIWELDVRDNRLIWDDWMHSIYGIPRHGFSGRLDAWQDAVHPDDIARAGAEVEKCLSGGDSFDSEFRIVRPDGEVRHIRAYARLSRGEDGSPQRMTGVNIDITESKANTLRLAELNAMLREKSQELAALAFKDGLTGVANRRHFDESLATSWRRCRRDGTPMALLMIDIDHFKRYNDRYGHLAGDDVLKTVAGIIQDRLGRADDMVARYGGEEFACLLPDSPAAGAHAKAEEIRQAIQSAHIEHADSPTATVVTVSIGVAALVPGADDEPAQLIEAADAALYSAKDAGRNRVHQGARILPFENGGGQG